MKNTARSAAQGALTAALLFSLAGPAAAQYTSFSSRTVVAATDDLGTDDLEITPDGRYAIYRDTAILTHTKVIDLETGQYVLEIESDRGPDCSSPFDPTCSGPCNDALAVTNQRAISLGQQVQLIDLTAQPPVGIATFDCGKWPRDVVLSDDGSLAVIRGGEGPRGGTYVIDMMTGAQLLFTPSQPRPIVFQLGSDLAAASEFHGVTLSYDDGDVETDVLVVEFAPSGGGGPQVVFDSAQTTGFIGDPMDVVISPNGQYATVRTSEQVVVLRLDGVNTSVVRTFNSFPGGTFPYGTTTTDTIVSNDRVWATITIADGVTSDGYLNVQDLATGQEWFAFLDGSPRDLVLTPDNESLLVHTGQKIYRFDVANLPATAPLSNSNFRQFPASEAGILAGIDSVATTNERAIVMAPTGIDTRVRIYDLTAGLTPNRVFGTVLQGRPIDVDIAEDGSYAVAVTQESYLVVDLRTNEERVRVERTLGGNLGWPWSDGAAIHPKHLIVGGIEDIHWLGWADTVDLVSREDLSCRSLPNSTGEVGDLFALGSTRVEENDLSLNACFLPPNAAGLFFLASGTNQIPLGGGILCIGGTILRLPVVTASAEGTVSYDVDLTMLPPAGAGIVAGSTWYAQLAHRDLPGSGGFNYSNASALLFE